MIDNEKINKLVESLREWDGVQAWENGEFIQCDYNGAFDLMNDAADMLSNLQAQINKLLESESL